MSGVSITDIASAAGVSPSTVSRALGDHPRISAERRAEIQALASRMGYRPSQVARSLVTGRTQTLGVVVTDVTDPFVAGVMKGAEAAAREKGYTLLFAMSNREVPGELAAAQALLDRQVDGMIVVSSRAGEAYRELLAANRRAGAALPFVLVNTELALPGCYSVRMDNRGGARLATAYLKALGHRRIAFIAGPPGGRSSRERLAGYRDAMAEDGVVEEMILDGNGLLEDGLRALARLAERGSEPTAVLCYNDMTAIGLLAAAHQAGVRVPDRLSVMGYDNIAFSAFTIPPLSTVDQPRERLGRLAVETGIAALSGEEVGNTVLPGELVVRASVSKRPG